MSNLDYDSNLSHFSNNLNNKSIGFSERNNNISLCVTSTNGCSKSSPNKDEINNKLENNGIDTNNMLDVLKNNVNNFSKTVVDRYCISPKICVVQNDSLNVNKICESLKTNTKRVKLCDIKEIENMCDHSDKIISGTSTPGVRKMSILDILMNRDNCLDDITDNISEVYSSLTSSVNRYETCLDTFKNDIKSNEDDHTSSTTDFYYSNSDMNQIQTEDTTITEDDEIFDNIDDFEELIKCISNKEYFEKLDKPPPLSELDPEKIIRLEKVLFTVLEDLSNESNYKYRLFVVNISIQIIKDCKLDLEHMYNNLIDIMKYTYEFKNKTNSDLNGTFNVEEEMFLTLLSNSLSFVKLLNLDELVRLFRVLFPFFYNIYYVGIISLKIFEICKEVVKRLQFEQIQELLKFVRSNLVYFNSSMCNNLNIGDNNNVTSNKNNIENNINDNESIQKEVEIYNPNNIYYVNVVLLLFERIFVNGKSCVNNLNDNDEFTRIIGNNDEKESYGLFKQNLKVFVEEGFYNQNIGFRNYKIFIVMLLESMEFNRNIFTPFFILEMGNIFIQNIDMEYNNNNINKDKDNNEKENRKKEKEVKIEKLENIYKKEREIRRLQSLKMLIIISDYIYKLYDRILDLEYVDKHETKYIYNSNNNITSNNSNNISDFFDHIEIEGMNVFRGVKLENVKEYIMNYMNYISIQNTNMENINVDNRSKEEENNIIENKQKQDKMSDYLFYVLLKYYCYVNNVQKVDDLMSLLKIFKYLYRYNDKFNNRDFSKIMVNINYPYVLNYPYLPNVYGYVIECGIENGSRYDIGIECKQEYENNYRYHHNNYKYGHGYNYNYKNKYRNKYNSISNNNMENKVDILVQNVYIYYVLHELYDDVMDCIVNIIYSSNENSILRTAIQFISNMVYSNPRYLFNNNIQNLLLVSLSDYNVYVRQKVIGIYSNFLMQYWNYNIRNGNNRIDNIKNSREDSNNKDNKNIEQYKENIYEYILLKYINKEILNKLLTCTKDVNYKIRIESIKVFHMFLSIVDIRNYLDVISILAQRSLESYREHMKVKNTLYSLLSSVFFVYVPKIFDCRFDLVDNNINNNTSNNTNTSNNSNSDDEDEDNNYRNNIKNNNKRRKRGVKEDKKNKDEIKDKQNTNKTKEQKENNIIENKEKQVIDENKMGVLEELVKIILYKMESYKGNVNPVLIMINYFNSNYSLINDPILYYSNNSNEIVNNMNSKKDKKNKNKDNRNKVDKDDDNNNNNTKNSEKVVNIWLDNMLDLFLLKRSKGSNYYELAEILSVFKLFGEVYPRLFVQHLIYFTPYLKIVNEGKLDIDQINLIILINNLVVIVYKYLKNTNNRDINDSNKDGEDKNSNKNKRNKIDRNNNNNKDKEIKEDNNYEQEDYDIWYELNSINNSVMGLINYNSPILIRSIIQLLSYNNKECIMRIYDVSYKYLVNLRRKLVIVVSNNKNGYENNSNNNRNRMYEEENDNKNKENRINGYDNSNNKDNRKIIIENKYIVDINIYKYSWQLGCICEFNEVELKVFEMFVEMYKYYNELKIYNISGLFIECCCRYLSNIDNLYKIDLKEMKKLLNEMYDYLVEDIDKNSNNNNNLVLILYQLLNNYQILSSKTSNDSNKSEVLNMVYVVVQKYIGVFVSLVVRYENRRNEYNKEEMIDRGSELNGINKLNGYEDNIGDKQNTNKTKEQKENSIIENKQKQDKDNCGLYMEIIEIIIVNRLTSIHELLPFIFSQIMSNNSQVQRIAEHNLKLIIKNDVNLFINRLNTCFTNLFYNIVNQFFEYNFILGVNGSNTYSAVQGIFRIYLEVLQTKRSNVKLFVTSILMQKKSIINQEIIENILNIIRKNKGFRYYILYGNEDNNKGLSNKLNNIITKIIKKEGIEREELLLEYFLYLYSNLLCVILDGLSFNNKRDANFTISKIHDIVNDNNHILSKYQKISTFTNIKLKNISGKIKNIYK